MKKNLVKFVSIIIMSLVLFVGCGTEQAAQVVATKAIGVYIDSFLEDTSSEELQAVLTENREDFGLLALKYFLEEPSIQDLALKDKVKQSVLLAADELAKEKQTADQGQG